MRTAAQPTPLLPFFCRAGKGSVFQAGRSWPVDRFALGRASTQLPQAFVDCRLVSGTVRLGDLLPDAIPVQLEVLVSAVLPEAVRDVEVPRRIGGLSCSLPAL